MRLVQNLLLICGLVGLVLFAPQPARAQTDTACLTDSRNLRIKPAVILDCLRTGQSVNFDGVTVDGDLDFTSLNINSQPGIAVSNALTISNSHFTGSLISFDGDAKTVLIFQKQVDLRGSQFDGTVDFTATTFEDFAHFENIRFEAGANFTQAIFQNGASFYNTIFTESASFMLANISGGIDFSEAQFSPLANFSWLRSTQSPDPLLQADVSFSGARFTGGVYFMDAFFENLVFFNDATFTRISPVDAVQFPNATFSTLDLTDARFESGQLYLGDLDYGKFIMPNFSPAILAPQNSVETLSVLKDNFRKQGNLKIANEITYWQNGLQRKEKPMLVQILETIFLDWTFGYGLKPLHSVRTSVILILFFGIFYYPVGTLRAATFAPSKPRERKFTIRLSELPIAQDEEAAEAPEETHRSCPLSPQIVQAWQAVAFSFGVFTKLSFGKYVAVRRASLVVAEWFIGLMMIAGFLFSLANTNPLLRSVLDLIK